MRRLMRRLLISTDSAYIDPIGCDSTISYKVVKGKRLSGNVQLADCNRKIDWYFHNDKTALSKIDKAIEMLEAFREEFAKAQKAGRTKPVKKPVKKPVSKELWPV